MPTIKPFKAWRPQAQYAKRVASPPYDVISVEEARALAAGNELSFLHVVKPEINFSAGAEAGEAIYPSAKHYFEQLIQRGIFYQDQEECLYLYQLQQDTHIQTGILALASVADYFNGNIKIHELTRPDKEEDRKNHVRVGKMHPEPVFFAYPASVPLEKLIQTLTQPKPDTQFVADDGIQHRIWKISSPITINQIVTLFRAVPASYVADGHHRTAAAAKVGKELLEANPHHTGVEPYNFFMAVHFPDSQLQIWDYNRLVSDLNGWEPATLIHQLEAHFDINQENRPVKPQQLHEIGMYLEGSWYRLIAKRHTYDPQDPILVLDVSVLSQYILGPLLGINDLRTDNRIDFVGGIRGMAELEKRVNSGEMRIAFSLFPVSMAQLIAISDAGKLMPPKTTWFEPKLRSGLAVYRFTD